MQEGLGSASGSSPLGLPVGFVPLCCIWDKKVIPLLVSAQSSCLLGCCKNPASPAELKHSVMSVFSLNTTETSCGI